MDNFWKYVNITKSLFLTGFVALLPFTITVAVAISIVNFFTDPFQGLVRSLLIYYDLFDKPFLFFTADQVLFLTGKILVLLLMVGMIIFIGFLGQQVIFNPAFTHINRFILRIPIINKIYKATKEIVAHFFNSKGISFSHVVLVPFPTKKSYVIGLISIDRQTFANSSLVSVFIPGTPIPAGGLILIYRKDDVIFSEMKVEEALKFIVSCGIMFAGFQIPRET